MRTAALIISSIALAATSRADFSYTMTTKVTGGMMASMMGTGQDRTGHVFLKGNKMKTDSGNMVMIVDFDAQTVTTINNPAKTISIRSLTANPLAKTPEVHMDMKETGQKKLVNGFNASEVVMNIDTSVEMSGGRGPMKVQTESTIWVSPDVPGGGELRAFAEKGGMGNLIASGSGQNAGLQSAIEEIQKKMGSVRGVPVQQVIRVKSSSLSAAMPQVSGDQATKMQDGLAKARAQLEAMVQKGGPAAAIAQQQLAKLPGGAPAASSGGSSGALIEMTMDYSGFSTAAIPDSAFAIPADYQTVK